MHGSGDIRPSPLLRSSCRAETAKAAPWRFHEPKPMSWTGAKSFALAIVHRDGKQTPGSPARRGGILVPDAMKTVKNDGTAASGSERGLQILIVDWRKGFKWSMESHELLLSTYGRWTRLQHEVRT